MANVYFRKINSNSLEEISSSARHLLETIISKENIYLEKEIPLKVHFGEKGNITFIKPKCFDGIISFLKSKNIASSYIETNALYVGERTTKEKHINLAKEHGFTQLPIIIADGNLGEEYQEIEINKKHFKKCKIGKQFSNYNQIIVLSHFKGHMLAGFGGTIKQLGMGCASRAGKLDMHANSFPLLNPLKCKKCHTCEKSCPADAISIGLISKINKKKCIGCATCIAVCPYHAITINWLSTLPKIFHEKLAEYAYAAHKDKKNIYIQFAINITKECDCMHRELKPIAKDIGIFASTDPVAVDTACMDYINKQEGKKVFGGRDILDYSEKLGLGEKEYKLIEV